MFAGAEFCEKCGARRARHEQERDASSPCPACKQALQHVSVGQLTMLECGRCDGIWLDAAVFERLCADKESQAAVLHRTGRERTSSADAKGRVKYRPCPRCGKMMNRVNFGKLSGTVVDVCRGHGTFMDAGELHQIVAFIQDGGLERARARQIEEKREEQRKLEAQQRQASRTRESHGPTLKTSVGGSSLDPKLIADLIDLIRRS
jgi:Zn-finger nucleic acid-binding protein